MVRQLTLLVLLQLQAYASAAQAGPAPRVLEGPWQFELFAPSTGTLIATGQLDLDRWSAARDSTTFPPDRRPRLASGDSGRILWDSVIPPGPLHGPGQWVGTLTWLTHDPALRLPPARLLWAAWRQDSLVVTIGRPYHFDAGNWRATLVSAGAALVGTCRIEGWTDTYLGRCRLTAGR